MAEERSRFGIRNLGAAAALTAYAFFAAAYGPDGSFPGADFGSLAYGLSRQGLWFIPVGVLIPLALPRMRGVLSGFFLVLLPSLLIGTVVTALVIAAPDAAPWRVLESFAFPEVATLLAPLTGMFVGALFGAVIARGPGSALVLIPVLVAIAAVLLASVAVLLLLITDRVAVTDPIGPPGSPDGQYRDAFAEFYRDGAPGSQATLNAGTFAAGFRLALAAVGVDPGVRFQAAPAGDAMEIAGSMPVAVPAFGERFLNIAATAQPTVEDSEFRAAFRSVRVGGIEAPPVLVRSSSRVLSRWLRRNTVVAALLAPFDEVRIADSMIVVRWREREDTGAGIHSRVGGYLTLLVRDADLLREQPDRTSAVLRRTFALAAVRSVGGDALAENRAALLALGGAFGHPSLLDLARVPGGGEEARGLLGRLPLSLHGRRDWARHFFLSAGHRAGGARRRLGRGRAAEGTARCSGGRDRILLRRSAHGRGGDPVRADGDRRCRASSLDAGPARPRRSGKTTWRRPMPGFPRGSAPPVWRPSSAGWGARASGMSRRRSCAAWNALPLYRMQLPDAPAGIAPPSGTLPGTP